MAAKKPFSSIADARLAVADRWGIGATISLEAKPDLSIRSLSTGIFLLDKALGVGGFPLGRIIELYGSPSSGKSSAAQAAARTCQAQGKAVLYLDYEHSFDPTYARDKFGVDISDDMFVLSQPDTLEMGMTLAEQFLEANLVGLIIVDSVAAMTTIKELETELEDQKQPAQLAKAMAGALRRLTQKVDNAECPMLVINQVRQDLRSTGGFGVSKKTTPGGDALKFYSAVRIEFMHIEMIKGKAVDILTGRRVDAPIAKKIKAQIVKSKVAPPYKYATFYLHANRGICEEMSVLEIAESRDLIKRRGPRYILPWPSDSGKPETNLGSLDQVLECFDTHPNEYLSLRTQVIDALDQPVETKKQKTVEELLVLN